LQGYSDTGVGVAKKVQPSIVAITVEYSVNSIFNRTPSTATARGSGIIISEDGYILTNNHVINSSSSNKDAFYEIGKANKVIVKLYNDDTEYKGEIIGTDSQTDLAVIKIDKTDLTAAELGDSNSVKVGEFAMAIGNPLGLDSSVTCGIVSAINREVTDEDGNKYIDFLSSASSLNLGSCNEKITEAIQQQLKKCTQYTVAYTYSATMIEYAEKLTSIYPGGVKAKILFGNCGSDANDAAVKFARAYTGRTKIITFLNGYHGNTYGSSSLTTCTPRMHAKMGPFLPEIYHFPFFSSDMNDEECEKECLKEMERAFATYLPAEEEAAVIVEPLQGDGGLMPAHTIFMKKLYDICKKYGISADYLLGKTDSPKFYK